MKFLDSYIFSFLAFIIFSLFVSVSSQGENIAVFGGSGRTGSECVYQALKSGCKVSVLARDPSKVCIPQGSGGDSAGSPMLDNNLTIIQGDVKSQKDVEKIFKNQKVSGVIIALGGRTKDVGATMLTDGTTNVIHAMKKNSVKRVAVVTSIGCGDSAKQAPFSFRMLMRTVMKKVMSDKNNQEQLFLEGPGSDLEYCIVRPGGLGNGPPTGIINVIDGQAGSVQRADVADFCLEAVTDHRFPYIRKTPCISSVGGTSWVKSGGKEFDATNYVTGVVGGTAMMALGGVSIGQAIGDPTAGPSARACLGVGGACEVASGVCYLGSAASRCWAPSARLFLGGFGAFFHCLGRRLVIYGDSTPV